MEDGDERYAFTWPGKRDAIRQSQTVSTATLRPCEEESVAADGTPGSWEGTENLYIEGDNLEVLCGTTSSIFPARNFGRAAKR